MSYPTDIEIAQACVMKPITEIAKTAHVDEKYIEQYGKYKAKIDPALIKETKKEIMEWILLRKNFLFFLTDLWLQHQMK